MNFTTTASIAAETAGRISSHFGAVDYAVFGLLLSLSAAIGIYFGFFDGSEKTTEEYLLGGRRMRPIPVAISLVASQLSAYSIISVPSDIYSFGSQYTMVVVPVVIAMTLTINYGILPVFFHSNVDNCYGYLELRFGKTIRSFTTLVFVFTVTMMLPVGSFLPAFAFAEISGLNLHMINAVVSVICVTYTMLGGVKAVIWTDVVQAFVMVFALLMVIVCAVVRIGGIAETIERAIEGGRLFTPIFVLDLHTRHTVWNLFSGMYLMWLAHCTFSQSCVQRLASLPSLKDGRTAMNVFCAGVILIKCAVGAIGLIMFAYYNDCDPVRAGLLSKPDKLMPHFVNEIVGHISGMPGLFISCVFSASLSTVSAYLNCISGLLYKDYVCSIKAYRHTEYRANVIMKLIIVALGVYSVAMGFMVEGSGSLFQVQSTIIGLTIGGVVGIFTLALFYPWASHTATMCGAVTSMALMAWIIVGSIMHKTNVYIPLPTSIDGCAARNITIAFRPESVLTTTIATPTHTETSFSLYNMSFEWYALTGTLIVWVVGVVLSHTIARLEKPVDPVLLSPFVRWMAPKVVATVGHTEMRLVKSSRTDIEAVTESTYKMGIK